jgi:hypothetical protein
MVAAVSDGSRVVTAIPTSAVEPSRRCTRQRVDGWYDEAANAERCQNDRRSLDLQHAWLR